MKYETNADQMNVSFLNKMTGWQRLFTATLAFIYIPLVVILFPSTPTIYPLSNEEILKITPTDALVLMHAEKISLSSELSMKKYLDGFQYPLIYENILNKSYSLEFTDEVNIEDRKRITKEFQMSLDSTFKRKVLIEKIEFLLIALLPPIFFYIFGLTIGWVFRGFKK